MKCPDPDVKIIYSNYALRIGQNVKNYHWQAVAKTLEANAYISKGKLPNAITVITSYSIHYTKLYEGIFCY